MRMGLSLQATSAAERTPEIYSYLHRQKVVQSNWHNCRPYKRIELETILMVVHYTSGQFCCKELMHGLFQTFKDSAKESAGSRDVVIEK